MLGLIAKEILGESTASGNLAERERFELAVRVLIQRLRGAHPPRPIPPQMPSRVATRWRFLKSKKPPPRAAFRFNADLSAPYFGCGDRI
jgi:hypothetical protein